MSCRKFETEFKNLLPDLLLDRERVPAAVTAPMWTSAQIAARNWRLLKRPCWRWTAGRVRSLRRFLMPGWRRGCARSARLRQAGFLERMRARLVFGSNLHLRPLAAGALALLLLIGGGTYAGFEGLGHSTAPVAASATVKDLQSFDENAQVFQQMNSLDEPDDNSASQGSN